MKSNKLCDLGEFKLVSHFVKKSRLIRIKPEPAVHSGDDAFAGGISKGKELVVSKDVLVEGVHFSNRLMSYRQIGRKSMLVNLSDLAAMGGVTPLYALVGCALPKNFDSKNIIDMFDGLCGAARDFGCAIVGGDTVSSKKGVFLSVTVMGEAFKKDLIKRSTAKTGDLIFSTGKLGCSDLGLRLLMKGKKGFSSLKSAHINPKPRFEEAALLARNKAANAMIDSSDGLEVCIREIANSSNLGACVDVDILADDSELRKACGMLSLDPRQICVSGGEDYQLVFTAPESKEKFINRHMPQAFKIGRMVKRPGGIKYFYKGREFKSGRGYEHF